MKGPISIVCSQLMDSDHKLSYMEHREKDLNISWELSEWQDKANNLSETSISTALMESNYKTPLSIHFGVLIQLV